MKKDSKVESFHKLECSLILIDLSGFTQLLYHASYKEDIMKAVVLAMKRMFQYASETASLSKDVQIANTTGDGFIALATGKTPELTAVKYAQNIRTHFKHFVASFIDSVHFRQRLDLRIALHHGFVYKIETKGLSEGSRPIFIGDDVNLLARVINGQVARRYGVAATKTFYKRLMLVKDKELLTSDEVILDRNQYPEQIDIFRLPEHFPDSIAKQKRRTRKYEN